MNYHTLPCGTPIPPEGIEAWVRDIFSKSWLNVTIISSAYDLVHTDSGDRYHQYSLTDPTLPKRRLVTPMELLGKYAHFNECNFVTFVESSNAHCVYCCGNVFTVDDLVGCAKGYSDTPTSPINSFWVEEV
jgi:hypothetical protein